MKKIKYLILSLLAVSLLSACVHNDSDELTGDAIEGGLVDVHNPLLSYVVASGATYSASGAVYQGEVTTSTIEIYNTFTNSVTGSVSNTVLLTTVNISETQTGQNPTFGFTFTYEQLIEGIMIDGQPLPADDSGLNIGDFWSLSYVSHTSTNNWNTNGNITKVAVGTRYAGIYDTSESSYWNSGSLQGGNFDGTARIIESVNASVYRHVGLAYWDDNVYYFTVDSATNYITTLEEYPAGEATLLNGSPIMTCAGGQFESIPCNPSTSTAVPDDVNGADVLKLTVGYFRGAGATREFFENLTKQ